MTVLSTDIVHSKVTGSIVKSLSIEKMQRQSMDWSELCPEILLEIADRLGTRPDVYNFRQVCRNWRFSLSYIPRTLPHLSPLCPRRFCAVDSDFFSSLSRGTLHHVIADAVCLLRPNNLPDFSKPWLVTVEEFYRGKLCVRLPLSRVRAYGILNFPMNLNLFDFDVKLIARGFSVRAPEFDKTLSENGGLGFKNKLVLFANPDALGRLTMNEYTGLVWFGHGSVAWVRLSRSLDWGFLSCKGTSKFDDIVNYRGKVYVVDRRGRLYEVNYDLEWTKGSKCHQTLRMECVVNDPILSGCDTDRRKRLVVDSYGVLYLVERVVNFGDNVNFKIYKVDDENGALEEVMGIGDDRILFVGVDWCFFASTADFNGWRGNCVIFSIESFPTYGEGRFSRILFDEPFFQGRNKELEFGVFHFGDGDGGLISDFPGYSDFLWPPPSWFCSASSSS